MRINRRTSATAASLALGAALVAGLAACSTPSGPAPVPAPTSAAPSQAASAVPAAAEASEAPVSVAAVGTADASGATQMGAKAATDAFFAQIAADSKAYQSKVSASMDKAVMGAVFDDAFQGTYALMKPGAFTADQRREIAQGFAGFYIMDPATKIESKPESYVLDGSTATIKGTDFTITMAGQVQKQDTSGGKGGVMTLELVDGTWLVTGVTT